MVAYLSTLNVQLTCSYCTKFDEAPRGSLSDEKANESPLKILYEGVVVSLVDHNRE